MIRFVTTLILTILLGSSSMFGSLAHAQTPTNCSAPTHTIGATESCSKIFPISGTCGAVNPVWLKAPWESVSITLKEADYDIYIQGNPADTFYASAFIGNSWTPDPMTPQGNFVAYPPGPAISSGYLIVSDHAPVYGAQLPSNATPSAHLDFYISCRSQAANGTVSYPAFNGTVRVVYQLNPT